MRSQERMLALASLSACAFTTLPHHHATCSLRRAAVSNIDDDLTPKELADSVISNVFEGDFGSRGEAWVLGQAVIIGSVLAAPDLPGLPLLSRVVGFAILLGGGAIAVIAAADLGTSLSPWPKPTDANALQTDGIYSLCRHPIYTGFLSLCGGLGLLTASPERLLLTMGLFVLLSGKATAEEEFMAAKHGDSYTAWSEEVPRFFPKADAVRALMGTRGAE